MNTDDGIIYRDHEIELARQRGEPIVEVSETVAKKMELANLLQQAKALADEIEALSPPSPIDVKPGELLQPKVQP